MIEAINISKSFRQRKILSSFNASIEKNCLTVITGDSGRGKTTLLNILSFLEKPDEGIVKINSLSNPNQKQTMHLRRHTISHLFQNYGLIDEYTVEKNLLLSLAYKKTKNTKLDVSEALAQVGLVGCEKQKVYELSGGEQQRVALARVLLKDACYIFADEPTGNLDVGNRDVVVNLLKELASKGKGVVLATHDLKLLEYADQHIHL